MFRVVLGTWAFSGGRGFDCFFFFSVSSPTSLSEREPLD
jgi:hypothetical protein